MPQPRRLNPATRGRRTRRIPAYRVGTGRAARHGDATPVPPTSDALAPEATQAPDALSEQTMRFEVSPPVAPAPPRTEDSAPGSTQQEASTTTPGTEPAAAAPEPDGAASTGATAETDAVASEHDFAEYARSVEEAAARSRAGVAASSSSATDTVALPGLPAAGTEAEISHEGARRPRPASGRGGRGRGGTRRRTAREPDPRPWYRRPRRWLAIGGVLLGITLATVAGYVLYLALVTYDAYQEAHVEPTDRTRWRINPQGTPEPIPTEEVQQQLPNWDAKDPVNILLMGIDERAGDEDPPRSDTIIVVRIDPQTTQVTMLSLPRDLWVDIPGHGPDKINAAYPIAEFQLEGSGPALVAETIEYNFGIGIDYFVTVDFSAFRYIVDTLGGIVIDVRAPVKDDQYPTDDLRLTREYFPTGLQKMDGETALRYSRTRHGDNDIARGDRQQEVLLALREKIEPNFGLIFDADELIRELGESVQFDLNFEQIQALANLARGVDPAQIIRLNLWEAGALAEHVPEWDGDAFYLEGDWTLIHGLVAQYFSTQSAGAALPTPTPPPAGPAEEAVPDTDAIVGETTDEEPPDDPATVTGEPNLAIPVIVANASSDELAATSVSEILYTAGFETVLPEQSGELVGTTLIYDYVDDPATAYYIAVQLGLDTSAIVPGRGGNGIVVVVGDDLAGVRGNE